MNPTCASTVFFAICLFFALAAPVQASKDIVQKHVPEAEQVGSVRFRYLFFDIYDASLYAPEGEFAEDEPFALKLVYLRDIQGEHIARQSIEEMRKQGVDNDVLLQNWQTQMQALFPDINEGDALLGIRVAADMALFFHNHTLIGEVSDPLFIERFFDIWLGENVRSARLQAKLLGK